MTRLIVHSRVDPDGILRVSVPVGVEEVDREMQITIEPVSPPGTPAQDYAAWVDSINGAWQGEFERMPLGEFERREAL